MEKRYDVIEHITWGTILEGNYYLRTNSELIIKVLAFLAYITPKNSSRNYDIDFSDNDTYKKGLHNLYRYYQKNSNEKNNRISELLYHIDKAIDIKFDNVGGAYNLIYNSYLKESADSLINLFDYAERNTPINFNVNADITNSEISKIVKHILNIKNKSNVLDIASGRGSFLSLEATNNKNSTYYGCDPVFLNVLLSSMRLEIQGVKYNIIQDDILSGKLYKDGLKFDNIFADFPWMAKTGNDDMSYLEDIKMPISSSNRADWRFVKMTLNLLSKKGKAVIVMNEGTLFNQIDEISRKFLIDNGFIETIISMPLRTKTNLSVPYSLVVFSYGNEDVKFIDATDCYIEDSRFRTIDVNRIIDLYESKPSVFNNKSRKKDKFNSVLVKKEIIKSQNNILSIGRYIEANKVSLINPTPLIDVSLDIFRGYQTTSEKIKLLTKNEGKKDYEILQLSNIDENGIYENLTKISAPSKGIEKFLLKENDIVISTKSLNIKVALVKKVGDRKIIPTGSMIVVRANEEIINPTYLFVFLNSNTGKTKLSSIQTGSVIMSINSKALEKMDISYPDKEIQDVIADRFNQLSFNYDVAMKQVKTAKQKIDALYEEEVGDLD